MIEFILSLMSLLQSPTAPGVTWDYTPVAVAIARAAQKDPLWPRDAGGAEKTIDTLVSFAFFESTFQADAVGDHGGSVGLFQINPETARASADALTDPLFAAETAIRLLRVSMEVCKDRPESERYAWYAHGGKGCSSPSGRLKSRHRFWKAQWLQRTRPLPESALFGVN